MQTLKSVLDGAAGEGIISADQAGLLLPYMEGRGVSLQEPLQADTLDVAGLAEERVIAPVEDTEAPRFVRGFHDVLITIGVAIVMVGVWGVGAFAAALPAIIILAEILVKRQRLALPAVLLTMLYVHWIFVTTIIVLDGLMAREPEPMLHFVLVVAPFALLLLPFHWRYRIPLSLSLWFLSLAAVALALIVLALARLTGSADFIVAHPIASSGIFFAAALGLLRWRCPTICPTGFASRTGPTSPSWLHLITAPALLYSTLAFVFLGDFANDRLFSGNKGLGRCTRHRRRGRRAHGDRAHH